MKIAIALATLAVLVIAVGIASRATAQASDCVSGGVVPAGNDDLTADCKTDDDGDGGIVISTPTPLPTSSVSDMVERVRPAVVKISAPGYQPYAIGTGFIFATVPTKKTAYLLTNYHVFEASPELRVMVNDSDWYEPKIAFLDARRDLAVLEICCGEFTSVDFADSDLLRAGDEVIAIGYPEDFSMPRDLTLSRVIIPGEASVTRGMISAFRYSSTYDAQLVQTDAAINQGNSGGPLFTLDGRVAAMNTFGFDFALVDNVTFSVLENTIQEKLRIWAEGPASQFGPAEVSIPDVVDDGLIGLYTLPDFEATDDEFQITATFVNPSTPFSYGFRFGVRETDDDSFMYFVVDSGKGWTLFIYEPDREDKWTRTLAGSVPQLLTGEGEKNTLRLLVDGRYGALAVNGIPVYLNDEPISPHTDLGSERRIAAHGGNVALATGIIKETGKDSATKVEDVTAVTYSHEPSTGESRPPATSTNTATPTPTTPTATPTPTPEPEATTGPASPSNQRYVWRGSTTVVSWDAVSDADSYSIYYDDFFDSNCKLSSRGTPLFCEELATNIRGTSYTHSSPDDDNNYYWVVACNSGGCSDIDSDNPATAPSTPVPPTPVPTTPTPTPTPDPLPDDPLDFEITECSAESGSIGFWDITIEVTVTSSADINVHHGTVTGHANDKLVDIESLRRGVWDRGDSDDYTLTGSIVTASDTLSCSARIQYTFGAADSTTEAAVTSSTGQ